ncbi:hypothetical protein [Mycobacterium sp. DBP42]|uniref:hypothetical protein n=1 Tax=Mycobacterium sp. DBP42 TaxID=2545267 RepID=UPI00110CAE6A|nr:hypothetical protein [Mycobacterium sp. DBP42]TMS50674.1 hypothetical protein E0T84_22550 [Mycobacterium sp. DBP42]
MTSTDKPFPADTDLIYGVSDHDSSHHILTRAAADAGMNASAICGHPTTVASAWGPYNTAAPHPGRCHECRWILAIQRDTIAAEIATYTPDPVDSAVITAILGSPLIGVDVLTAIADSSVKVHHDRNLNPSRLSQLLSHASRHQPTVTLCEECVEIGIVNAHGFGSICPEQSVICHSCTPHAVEAWAGEREGTVLTECTVAAPCSVLSTLARHYGVALGTASTRSANTRSQLLLENR